MKTQHAFTFLLMCLVTLIEAKADHPTLSLEDGRPGPVTTLSAIP